MSSYFFGSSYFGSSYFGGSSYWYPSSSYWGGGGWSYSSYYWGRRLEESGVKAVEKPVEKVVSVPKIHKDYVHHDYSYPSSKRMLQTAPPQAKAKGKGGGNQRERGTYGDLLCEGVNEGVMCSQCPTNYYLNSTGLCAVCEGYEPEFNPEMVFIIIIMFFVFSIPLAMHIA